MEILFVLIPISLILLCVAIAAFLWAVNNRQFDDLDSPAHKMLLDDDRHLFPRAEQRQNGDSDQQ